MFEPGKLQHLISTDRATARKVEAAPFTLESLIAWLETKDPAERYDFFCHGGCLWGLYTIESGGLLDLDKSTYHIGEYSLTSISVYWPEPWRASVAALTPYTCGEALTRAQAALERLK